MSVGPPGGTPKNGLLSKIKRLYFYKIFPSNRIDTIPESRSLTVCILHLDAWEGSKDVSILTMQESV